MTEVSLIHDVHVCDLRVPLALLLPTNSGALTLFASAFVVPTVASCIDLVVHCTRRPSGQRQVTEILALGRRVENGIIESSTLFRMSGGSLQAVATSGMPAADKFERAGYNVAELLEQAA